MNAIRAFEAAAQHESFARAAEDLHVTAGAVSRQVKALEKMLQIPLFTRTNSEARLTPEGRAYFNTVTEALRLIDGATSRLLNARRQRPIRVSCSVLFAMRWLFPRLSRFQFEHAQFQLSLPTTLMPVGTEFDADHLDVVIRLGSGNWGPEVSCHHLFASELVVICSPKFLEGKILKRPSDLVRFPLLYSALRADAWPGWFKVAGLPADELRNATMLESSTLAYQAAIDGLGIAIGERRFIDDDIKHKRLVVPFREVYASSESFFIICPRHAERNQRLREFRDWIVNEAHLQQSEIEQRSKTRGARSPTAGRRLQASGRPMPQGS
jgi:LysR family transcriptional regulator, glycine cleavage system transcriptional activator